MPPLVHQNIAVLRDDRLQSFNIFLRNAFIANHFLGHDFNNNVNPWPNTVNMGWPMIFGVDDNFKRANHEDRRHVFHYTYIAHICQVLDLENNYGEHFFVENNLFSGKFVLHAQSETQGIQLFRTFYFQLSWFEDRRLGGTIQLKRYLFSSCMQKMLFSYYSIYAIGVHMKKLILLLITISFTSFGANAEFYVWSKMNRGPEF